MIGSPGGSFPSFGRGFDSIVHLQEQLKKSDSRVHASSTLEGK
jgi:hypothetical protein